MEDRNDSKSSKSENVEKTEKYLKKEWNDDIGSFRRSYAYQQPKHD